MDFSDNNTYDGVFNFTTSAERVEQDLAASSQIRGIILIILSPC
jgi:hypothetical protein